MRAQKLYPRASDRKNAKTSMEALIFCIETCQPSILLFFFIKDFC